MNENNLDKLFREKLGDFRELPDEKVWRSLEASLDKKKQSRLIILPVWWKTAGVAAALAILFFAINPFGAPDNLTPAVTDTETRAKENALDPDPANPVIESLSQPSGVAATEKENISIPTTIPETKIDQASNPSSRPAPANSLATDTDKKDLRSLPNTPNTQQGIVASRTQDQKTDPKNSSTDQNKTIEPTKPPTTAPNRLPDALQDRLADSGKPGADPKDGLPTEEDKKIGEKKSIWDAIADQQETEEAVAHSRNRWSAGPSVAPIYFDAIGKGSSINPILAANPRSGNVTLSYGVNVAYEVTKKLRVRSGIHKVDMGYNTNGVSFTSTFIASSQAQLKNIDYNSNAESIVLQDMRPYYNAAPPTLSFPNSPNSPGSAITNANDVMAKTPGRMGTMEQQIGYLEVPLEINYALLESKFGIDLIGGVSSLFLTDNSVALQSSGKTTELGKANNINSINFSTNVGVGLNYKFTDKFKFSVEPVFKYQLNTFNNTSGNFNPYSLGVYSGFSFKF